MEPGFTWTGIDGATKGNDTVLLCIEHYLCEGLRWEKSDKSGGLYDNGVEL